MTPSQPVKAGWRPSVAALAISAGGGLIGQAIGLPAGLLMGGALAVAGASFAGIGAGLSPRVRDIAFVVLGTTLGTNVRADSLALASQWPISLLALVAMLGTIVSLTVFALHLFLKFDRATALLASFPGHLSMVVSIAEGGLGDSRRIAMVQSVRLILLTVVGPLSAWAVASDPYSNPAAPTAIGLPTLVVLFATCGAAGWVFARLKLPAAWVLGPMAVATGGKLAGIYVGTMPDVLAAVGFIAAGALIGTRFGSVRRADLREAAFGGLLVTGIAVLCTTVFAAGVAALSDLPFGQIWLGLAPGAFEAMAALGIALGYDPAFIVVHHTTRLLLLTLAIPTLAIVVARLAERQADAPSDPG